MLRRSIFLGTLGAIPLAAGVVVVLLPMTSGAEERTSELPADGKMELDRWAADAMLDPAARREFATPNVLAITDAVGNKNAAQELATSIEGAFYTINEVLGLGMRANPNPVRAYFFRDELKYRRFGGPQRGFYTRSGFLAFYQGSSCSEELLEVMVHEATHAFLDHFVTRPGVVLPMWIEEGFADYMGRSLIREGKIEPGVFYTRQPVNCSGGRAVIRSPITTRAKDLARHIAEGSAPDLARLLAADRKEFYGKNMSDYYASAWAFAHYLRHGVPDGPRKFSAMMRSLTDGIGSTAALESAYETSPSEIEATFHAYVADTLAHPPEPPADLMKRRHARR